MERMKSNRMAMTREWAEEEVAESSEIIGRGKRGGRAGDRM
jgi:hypothetical protein